MKDIIAINIRMENIHQTLNIFWLEESISYECNQTGRRQDIKLGKKRDSY
jgi:hypothetical protein